MSKLGNAIRDPAIIGRRFGWTVTNGWIALHNLFVRRAPVAAPGDRLLPEIEEIRRFASATTDISDHLENLFAEAVRKRPKLIVELGVRGGCSTFVLQRAASVCGAALISVDLDDCSSVSDRPGWMFVQADDVAFAAEFPRYCQARGIVPEIDVLFIDTSHLYDHTVQEIAHWFPLLSPRATVLFHDTNMRMVGRHRDGRLMRGTDNQRGVIGPLESYLGRRYDESRDFVDVVNGWLVRHDACSNGFTVLERLPPAGAGESLPSRADLEEMSDA